MPLTLVTPAVEQPVTLAEVKAHLRIGFSRDDDLLETMIARAVEFVRLDRDVVSVDETWQQTFTRAELAETYPELRLQLWPATAVNSVKYYNAADTLTTVGSGNYYDAGLALNPPTVFPKTGSWDWSLSATHPLPVQVEYVAGYGGAEDVPQVLKAIVTLLTAHAYERRDAVEPGQYYRELPWGLQSLLNQYSTGSLR